MFLYLDGYGYKVSKRGDVLVVEKSDGAKDEYPLAGIDAVYVSGECRISKSVILELTRRNVNTVILSGRGRPEVYLFPTRTKPMVWDIWKKQILIDPRKKRELLRKFVLKAIAAKAGLLTELARNRKRGDADVARRLLVYRNRIRGLERKAKSVQRQDFADLRRTLMGLEGFSAKLYFEALSDVVPHEFGYSGHRTTRPPGDLFNAAISFGYGYLKYLVERNLLLLGINPYYGILHEERDKVYSFLTFDLMEGLRHSYVDRTVISLISKKRLSPRKHTAKVPGGVLLNKRGRDNLYAAMQERGKKEFYRVLNREVRLFADQITGR